MNKSHSEELFIEEIYKKRNLCYKIP